MTSRTDQTTDVLRRRLASAERDTQQLMQQLEEMGFSTSSKSNIHNPRAAPDCLPNDPNEKDDVNVLEKEEINHTDSRVRDNTEQKIITSSKAVYNEEKKEKNESGAKSAKHKPITPFSLRGLAIPNVLEGSQVKSLSESQFSKTGDCQSRKRHHYRENGIGEMRVGRQELENELLHMKKLVSQLQEEVSFESECKDKAREEANDFKATVDAVMKSQAEKEMAIEDLSANKQRLTKGISELKESLSRETSLRGSLEESHKTLLARLQDMETVIESLRSEGKTQQTSSNSLKADVFRLKDELEQETSRRKKMEEVHVITLAEKDRFKLGLATAQSENQKASQELGRFQAQYSELISQLGHAQQATDALKTGKSNLEEEKQSLSEKVASLTTELESLKKLQQETKESENRLSAEKSALEADYCSMKAAKEQTEKTLKEKEIKLEQTEKELAVSKQTLTSKNHEFSSAASGLETEMGSLRKQLDAMEREKQNVLRDKESLLEEVNQTVDTLMAERSRLQTEVQASMLEGESLRVMCSKLEQDKAQMLERLSSYQSHQNTQRKVEESLNQMLEAKTKLAYENGKLQSTIQQLQLELENASQEQGDITQMKKLCQSLQAKYTQSQQEISEYKISLQRAEVQAKSALEDLAMKEQELKTAVTLREEAGRELDKVSGQLEVLEGREVHKVHNYKKSMEEAKLVNQDMASTLEAVMTSHTQLQTIVENLQVELGKRDSQVSQLKASKNQEVEDLKRQLSDYELQTQSLKTDWKKEKDSNHKKALREIAEIRKQNESMSGRNQELVRINTDLRQRLSDGEKEKEELKTKMSGQRHKMEYLHRAKKQLEDNLNKMKTVKKDISELEQMRDEYIKKNKDQATTISKFISQMASLQDEVKQVAQAHTTSQELLKLKEEALEKERRISHEMRKKYSNMKHREEDTHKESRQTNEKLKEVHSESREISKHLQEASDWFRGKFDKLQTELTASKLTHEKLAQDNKDQRESLEQERSKAEDAAQRAREMIQSSRQTISKLASYAEMSEADTKQQLAKLRAELQTTPGSNKLSMADLEVS